MINVNSVYIKKCVGVSKENKSYNYNEITLILDNVESPLIYLDFKNKILSDIVIDNVNYHLVKLESGQYCLKELNLRIDWSLTFYLNYLDLRG